MSNPASRHICGEKRNTCKKDRQKPVSFLAREAGLRRRGLRIPRFRLTAKALSLRRGSFPHANRFAVFSAGAPAKDGFFTPPRAKKERHPLDVFLFWCARRDLNPHVRKGH